MTAIDQDANPIGTRIQDQFSRTRSVLLVSISVGLICFLGIYALSFLTRLPFSYFTKDPAAITHSKFYIGILSNLGIMLWTATATICLFVALFLRCFENVSEFRWFLFSWGILTSLLTLDDAFLFHESLFPHHLHIPEEVVESCYGAITAGCLIRYYTLVRRTNYLLLILALILLGASVATDTLFANSEPEIFVEDGFKFFGIVFWLAYFFDTATEIIRDQCLASGPNARKR